MNFHNRDMGRYGEQLAENYLKKNGYIILEKNFKCRIGEIDIIGRDEKYISFIEVKTRFNKQYGTPAESVTFHKQQKIYMVAQTYITWKKIHHCHFRFDVLEIYLKSIDEVYQVRLIKDAFQIQNII